MKHEILEVEAEEVNPLEEVIEKTLVKNNVTDQVIASLKEKYSGLTLRSLDDKENYLIIKDAKKVVRGVGILTEKLCKAGREDAIAIQKKWLATEKSVLAKIAEVQDPLDAEIKKFEDEVERIANEEKERREQKFMARQTILLKMEAKYENNSYTLGNVSYELNNIKEADAEVWSDTILPKFQREFEKIEAVRAEEEKQREEAAKKLKEEQDKLAEQQEEFRKQQETFLQQQKELQDLKDKTDREERERQDAIQAQERQKLAELVSSRSAVLRGIGMSYDGSQYDFADIYINKAQVTDLEEKEWGELVEKTTASIKEWKDADEKRKEDKRLADIEEAKQAAIKQEEERRATAEKQRLEELEKAGDKEKWSVFVSQFNVPSPDFKSTIYKGKLSSALSLLKQIQIL